MPRVAWVPVVLLIACAGRAAPPDEPGASGASPHDSTAVTEPEDAEPPEARLEALRSEARVRYQAKDWRACADAYVELSGLAELTRGEAYDGACCLALVGDHETAITWLERSAAQGLRAAEHLQRDPDLLALHEHPRWPALVSKVQANLDEHLATINRELYEIYQADQGDRQDEEVDWSVVAERDRQRQLRVLAIVEAGEARTADDWVHAAMVMQHGASLDDYQRAHEWSLKAVELDPDHGLARWLAAAAKDRWLMNQGKPQLYGTQLIKEGDTWVLYEVDPTVTDEERARWKVPSLAEAQARANAMNQQ